MPSELYTLSLHDALPIFQSTFVLKRGRRKLVPVPRLLSSGSSNMAFFFAFSGSADKIKKNAMLLEPRSEEHTSELQSQSNLVCRLLLEKKNRKCSVSRSD